MLPEGSPPTALKLLNTGNAVLVNVGSGSILWQSFETPTDTFLPGMKMDTNMTLISWKSITDPGPGSFQFQQDQGTTQYSILNGSTKFLWKSGKMSSNSFDDNQIFPKAINLLSNITTQTQNIIIPIKPNHTGSWNRTSSSKTYTVVDPNSRLVMVHSGKLQYLTWSKVNSQWDIEWEEPKYDCSSYRVCGPFGMCRRNNDSLCSCLHGFEPKSLDDPTNGCKRTSEICEKSTIKDTFINITMISMDDPTLPFFVTNNESECITECLKDCVCLAYAYRSQNEGEIRDPSRKNTQGCWFWDAEPNNLKGEGTHNISFRVSNSVTSKEPSIDAPSEKPKTERKSSSSKRVLVISIVASAMAFSLFCGISYISYKRLANRRNKNQKNIEFMSGNTQTHINELLHLDHSKEEDREGIDVPYFELENIIAATDDFSEENRLGQGGFGPVYKYALNGMFSIKSDVFSFGVVLLEIVSGKRNTGFYQSQKTISLLAHAWSLWIEDKPFELLDQILMESYNSNEVLKCINVGLLCVQGDPDDRPTMTNAIMMLGGDMATLPNPKEPAFIPRRDQAISSSSSSSKLDSQTKNMFTITELLSETNVVP
ncbi:hypothetical protein L1987_32044 [Smallanthus sonchifolius]|uniref:Uncharacterized protein n=1 Tax=Smallanthus sonchifolius TaxID=185202 RepID=A0ACB9I7C0_9ASTR|nr:hypothetical protein L1987_32044 [Smallanthus sonchifolius]